MLKWRRESALDMYNLMLALFLSVTPWMFAYASEAARIDAWASGALIAAVSMATFIVFSNWEEYVNLLLGCWLVVSPWILGFGHTRAMHISVGIGAVVVFMATLEIWLLYDASCDAHSPSS